MAAFETTTELSGHPEQVFAEIADYTKAADWNPSYVSVTQTEGDGPGLDACYAVVFTFYGRHFDLEYKVVEYTPNDRLVLEATSKRVSARDEILVKRNGDTTLVHRLADFAFTGPLKVLDGGLQVAFEAMSKRAAEGIAEELDAA